MLRTYAVNLHKRVPPGAFPHKLNALSFHYTTDCTALFSLNQLQKNVTGWVAQLYFARYATRSFKHWKCKKSFKIFEPVVLKVTSLKRWNETVFQKFFWYLFGIPILNDVWKYFSINPVFNSVLSKVCLKCIETS